MMKSTRFSGLVRSIVLIAALVLPIGGGCSTLSLNDRFGGSPGNSLIPTRYQTDVGSFRVASNLPMDDDDPALLALEGLEERLGRVLGVRVDDDGPPIDIYILDDQQAFTTFLMFHHPELPNRRAFFLAVGDAAAVYTARGENLEEDLRHEATHALLHRALGPVPLWLDEGLAEYFEIEPHALPAEAISRFRKLAGSYREGWRPDLKRLEDLDQMDGMTPTDYREAWAWTLILLHGTKRDALIDHLDHIRIEGESTPAISELLRDDLARLNRQFLAQVAPGDAPQPRTLTRLQSPPSSPAEDRPIARAPAMPGRIIIPPEQGRVVPMPVEPPRGPIGRMRQGIGNALDRIFR